MSYSRLRSLVPTWLYRQVFFFEAEIEQRVAEFAQSLPPRTRLLDAGAGEGRFRSAFPHCRYCGVDLGVGDQSWNYSGLEALADLLRLPFRDQSFDAFLSVVTLEHVSDPGKAIAEMSRVAKPHARLLLVVPHEWEVHQHPHDYFRFTRYAVEHLLQQNGWRILTLRAGGGFFRLLSRRLMNALQFFPAPLMLLLAMIVVPLALLTAACDSLDQKQDYTLGYFVEAVREANG
jgi:SAM-dependent methyltransferase